MERGLKITLRINIESKKTSGVCRSAYFPGSRKKNMLIVFDKVLPV